MKLEVGQNYTTAHGSRASIWERRQIEGKWYYSGTIKDVGFGLWTTQGKDAYGVRDLDLCEGRRLFAKPLKTKELS